MEGTAHDILESEAKLWHQSISIVVAGRYLCEWWAIGTGDVVLHTFGHLMMGTVPRVTSALNSPSTMVLTAPCNHTPTA